MQKVVSLNTVLGQLENCVNPAVNGYLFFESETDKASKGQELTPLLYFVPEINWASNPRNPYCH